MIHSPIKIPTSAGKQNFYLSSMQRLCRLPHTFARRAGTLALVSAFAAFGLSACGENDKTAGGGSSGTEAGNAITAQIMVAGAPAAYAKAKLIESESLGDETLGDVEADKNGIVVFEKVPKGVYTLEAKLSGNALQTEVVVEDEDQDLGMENLEETVSVTGSIANDANGTVKVRGLAHSAKVTDGKFTLDSLPAGPLSLVFIPNAKDADTSCTYMKVIAGEKSVSSTFAEESRSLLLDDFQDSNYQNRFMPAHTYDGGWWFFDYSQGNVTAESITDDGSHKFLLEADESGNIYGHVAATMGDIITDSLGNSIWPWAVIGIELGKSDKTLCNDISSVDSIAFRTKGTGAIVFSLVDETQKPGEQDIAQYEFNLDKEWTRVSVPLKDILDPHYSYDCVNQLNWHFKSNTDDAKIEIWLDDIELIGGNRLSIWKR